MKIEYFPDTDSLYIDLSSNPSVDSKEFSDGVVADYDKSGNLVGIDIDQAKTKLDLRELDLRKIPFDTEKITAQGRSRRSDQRRYRAAIMLHVRQK